MTLHKHPKKATGLDVSRQIIGTYGTKAIVFDKLKGVREEWVEGMSSDSIEIDGRVYTHQAPLETVSSRLHLNFAQ